MATIISGISMSLDGFITGPTSIASTSWATAATYSTAGSGTGPARHRAAGRHGSRCGRSYGRRSYDLAEGDGDGVTADPPARSHASS